MSDNKDYLRFSANSMKDYIKQQLSEDSSFTDHLFEGSNLSVFVDVFSYMYNMMTFYLNNTASESMFTDSNLLENMNRIVKIIGYNPMGHRTAVTDVTMGISSTSSYNSEIKFIPKYTSVDTGIVDSFGSPVLYSLVEDYKLKFNKGKLINDELPTFYNGTWKLYPSILVSSGTPFETFVLDSKNMTSGEVVLSHGHIDVIIKTTDSDGSEVYEKWSPVAEISSLFDYGPLSRVYEIRLNEDL